jgi:heme O synthase-like polyprenyltransferase
LRSPASASASLAQEVFLGAALRFARSRSTAAARSVFLISVLYLPALLGLMVFDL